MEYQYDLPLPDKQKELLLKLVKEAKQQGVLSAWYGIHKPDDPPYYLHFVLGNEKIKVEFLEDPTPGFEVLGLIKQTDEHTIFLTPKVFKWAKYERKNCLLKWAERNPNIIRDVFLAISFLLSFALLILEVLQKFELSQMP